MQPNRIAQTIARACVVIALCSIGQGHSLASAQSPTGNPPVAVDQQWWRIVNAQSGNAPGQRGTHSAEAVQSIHVNLTDGVVAGSVNSLSPVTLRLKRNGAAISSHEGAPIFDGSGQRYAINMTDGMCTAYNPSACNVFRSGDVIEVFQNGVAQSVTVPPLTVNANAATNLVSGSTAPSQTVEIFAISGSASGAVFTQTATAAPNGAFQADFTALTDLVADDSGFAVLRPSGSTSFAMRYVLPFLRVYASNQWVYGRAAPASPVLLQASIASSIPGIVLYSDFHGKFGQYAGFLTEGNVIRATLGDQIRQLSIQPITAKLDSAQHITGQAAPAQIVRIRRYARTNHLNQLFGQGTLLDQENITADAGGRFTSTLTIGLDQTGMAAVPDADGDESAALVSTPTLVIRVDGSANAFPSRLPSSIVVRDGAPNSVVTVTLRGASGYAKNVWKQTSDPSGLAFSYDLGPLQPVLVANDIVEVAQPEQVISATVPVFTSTRDALTNRIFGMAPPNALVTLNVWTQPIPGGNFFSEREVSFATQSDSTGAYQFSLTGRVAADEYRQSVVTVRFGAGHEAYRSVDAVDTATSCSASIDEVEVRGSVALLSSTCQPTEAQLRLIAPNGNVKSSIPTVVHPFGQIRIDFMNYGTGPIQILPGDTLELFGPTRTSVLVPTMSATMESSGTVRGSAPSGAALSISIAQPFLSIGGYSIIPNTGFYTGTADSSGQFVIATLPSEAGTQAIVRVQTSSKPVWTVRTSLRQIVVELGDPSQISGPPGQLLLQPGEAFTATVTGNAIRQVWPFGPYGGGNEGFVYLYFEQAVAAGQSLQVIAGGQAMSLTIPAFAANYTEATRRVTGTAPAGARIELRAFSPNLARLIRHATTADSSGRFGFTIEQNIPLIPALSHVAYIGPGGHEARIRLTLLSSFAVTLDDLCAVLIRGNAGGTPSFNTYTMTITSAGGAVKASGLVSEGSGNSGICATVPVVSGDRITLQGPNGEARASVLPVHTASYNYRNSVLTGRSVANKPLLLSLQNSSGGVLGSREVFAGIDGAYGIDLSDLPAAAVSQAVLALIDDSGNLIMRRVSIINNPRWLPIAFRNPASDGMSPTEMPMPIPTGTPGPFPIPTSAPTAVP